MLIFQLSCVALLIASLQHIDCDVIIYHCGWVQSDFCNIVNDWNWTLLVSFLHDFLYATLFPAWGKTLQWEKPLSMGSFLMERIFQATPNTVLTAHTEWLPGVQLGIQYHLCSTYKGLCMWSLVWEQDYMCMAFQSEQNCQQFSCSNPFQFHGQTHIFIVNFVLIP